MSTEIDSFRKWFSRYVRTFMGFGPSHDQNIELKEAHSLRVLKEAEAIAASLEISPRLLSLIRLAALFHDIGRFPQYRDYRTFDDHRSVNHGLLGFRTLRREGILDRLPGADRKVILRTVFWHNRVHIPAGLPAELDLAVRVVRDADKLDIYQVLIGHLTVQGPKDETVTLGLMDAPEEFNPEIVRRIIDGKRVHYEQMLTINDFALLLCSWVTDLSFAAAKRAVWEREYIPVLCGTLPDNPQLRRLQDLLISQVRPAV